jgi:metal-sulfur cluster biosynthetic enzyme
VTEPERLRRAILDRLSRVIDPETGVDVLRMRLIEDLSVEENGRVSYKFHPSSPLCPIAVPLSMEIQCAVAGVEGVKEQDMQVVGYIQAEELTSLIRQALRERQGRAAGEVHARADAGKENLSE